MDPDRLSNWAARVPFALRYTDDTHMTLGTARSLVERGGRFDGEHMAREFAAAYREEPWRGYGPGPPKIFALIEQGVPWEQAAGELFDGEGSFGNGAAGRLALDAPPREVIDELGHGIEAHRSVPTAIYSFLRAPHSFAEAVCFAVALGGDADTIASMTGALSGAFLGAAAIPAPWRDEVEGAAVLCDLADELCRLAGERAPPGP
jgi:poly(ADP-ribose) glycohydrolase ARH3